MSSSIFARLLGRNRGVATPEADEVLRRAREAQAEGRWSEAVGHYRRHVALRPKRSGSRLQLGNMLKESGDLAGAEDAYRASLTLRRTPEALIQLGYLTLNDGRLDEAADLFAEVLKRFPGHHGGREGLVMAGARDRLPEFHVLPSRRSLAVLQRAVAGGEAVLKAVRCADLAPLSQYDAWRRRDDLEGPPVNLTNTVIEVCVLADGAAPYRLRGALQSLLRQEGVAWRAVVRGAGAHAGHPAASLAALDPRIVFSDSSPDDNVPHVVLKAGVVLHPFALAWLVHAATRTGADVVYADHDHLTQTGGEGEVFDAPVFFPTPSPIDLSTTPILPAVMWRRAGVEGRAGLVDAATRGRAAHLPFLLSSEMRLPAAARDGLPEPGDAGPGWLEAAPAPAVLRTEASSGRDDEPIRVIIPTRDEAGMLETCVAALLSRADRPERVRILIVDNRSVEAETARYLADGVRAGRFETLVADEPFNWSRLNNLAVSRTSEQTLLFLNNDAELLTQGWDRRLLDILQKPGVGAVGARLLYPDGSVQHGGLVLGLGEGSPRHEGVGASPGDKGPLERWVRSREAAAVTGAFLATRREVFDAVEGFDAQELAIAYNDVDYCLAVRGRGLSVVYAGDIEATHFESRTRGHDVTRARIAWDLAERTALTTRWGPALRQDPSVNPHWRTASSRPFDGLRRPDPQEAMDWLDASLDGTAVRLPAGGR